MLEKQTYNIITLGYYNKWNKTVKSDHFGYTGGIKEFLFW